MYARRPVGVKEANGSNAPSTLRVAKNARNGERSAFPELESFHAEPSCSGTDWLRGVGANCGFADDDFDFAAAPDQHGGRGGIFDLWISHWSLSRGRAQRVHSAGQCIPSGED